MSIQNYDKTVDYIEINITMDKETLSNTAEKILNIEGRKAGEFFSYIEPENKTLKKYIRDRKLYCALEEFIAGHIAEEIVEKYGISDASRFSSDIKLLVGKYPKVLRDEGYSIPKVQHLCDILKMNGQVSYTRTDLSIEEKRVFVSEIRRLIDENYELREDLSKMKVREIEKMNKSQDSEMKEEYLQFLMVEDCRRMYGFDVDQILKLYKESLKSKKSLETLCEEALFDFRFEYEEESERQKYEYMNSAEALQYHNTYEMDSKEAYDYYYGDDSLDELDDDPYAYDDMYEYAEEPDDINPEDSWEYQSIVESEEDDLLDKKLDWIQELIDSGELFEEDDKDKETKKEPKDNDSNIIYG